MVTVELAAALPVLMVITWACVLMLGAGLARVRCADAAREAALAWSLGSSADAQRRADLAAGRHVVLSTMPLPGRLVRVSASLGFTVPGWPGHLTIHEASVVTAP